MLDVLGSVGSEWQPHRAYRRQKAFTLGELLVVIGIIGLLAALLFPVFSQAPQAALQASAISNLRQVGIAQLLYSGDNEDMSAPYFSGFNPETVQYEGPQMYWPQLVSPYVQRLGVTHGYRGQAIDTDLPRVFFDPIVPLTPQAAGEAGNICSWGVSDAIVDWVGPKDYIPRRTPAVFSQLADSGQTYLDVETRDYFTPDRYPGDALALAPQSYYEYGINARFSTAGHYFGSDDFRFLPATGRSLIFFADGHASTRPASRVATRLEGWFRQSADIWP